MNPTGLPRPKPRLNVEAAKEPTVAPERAQPLREPPVRPEAPPTPVVEKAKVANKAAPPVPARRPELLTVEQKVKRLNDLQTKNLGSVPLQSIPREPVVRLRQTEKAAVARPLPVRVDPLVTQAHANLDLTALSRLPMKLSKVIKGNPDKLTCILAVGGVTYIVKAGRGYATMQDHITNTDLIIRLNIPGVRAPVTKEMTGEFLNALRGQLEVPDPSDKQLLDALGRYNQISKAAPGLTVQDVFDPANTALGGLLDTIRGQDSEGAVLALTGMLERSLNATKNMDRLNGLGLIAGLRDAATRADTIKVLKATLNIPANKQIVAVLENVSLPGSEAVIQKMTSDVARLADAKTKLTNYVKSEAGGYALGGMAITDVLVGMDDRIAGSEFNGGNFMFDPAQNQFWCVDNSKDPKYALSAADTSEWKTFARRVMTDYAGGSDEGLTLEGRLQWAIYDRKTQEAREISQNVELLAGDVVATTAGIQRAVRETVNKVQALVNDNTNNLPPSVRQALAARLEFIQVRKTFIDQLQFDPLFQTVPSATKPGVFTILGRNVKGVLAGRAADAEQAERWKNQARDPDTSEETLAGMDQNLTLVLQGLDPAHADQRFLKALFAARSARFTRSLVAKTATLSSLAKANKKAWGDASPAVIKSVTDIANPWLAKFDELGDKEGKQELNAALTGFLKQLNSRL